jgi:hypothetical protein
MSLSGWSPWGQAEDLAAVREDDTRLLSVPVRVGVIIRKLEHDAVGGSTMAAKELREWLREYPPQDEGYDLEALDRRTRDRLIARLLLELGEDDEIGA